MLFKEHDRLLFHLEELLKIISNQNEISQKFIDQSNYERLRHCEEYNSYLENTLTENLSVKTVKFWKETQLFCNLETIKNSNFEDFLGITKIGIGGFHQNKYGFAINYSKNNSLKFWELAFYRNIEEKLMSLGNKKDIFIYYTIGLSNLFCNEFFILDVTSKRKKVKSFGFVEDLGLKVHFPVFSVNLGIGYDYYWLDKKFNDLYFINNFNIILGLSINHF